MDKVVRRLFKLSMFCVVIIIIVCIVNIRNFTELGNKPKENNWNVRFLQEVEIINPDKCNNAFEKNIIQRGKWQQTRLKEYCSWYAEPEKIRWNHMLYDDNHKIVYCTVSKIASTTMKTMMVLLQGLYTLELLNNTVVTQAEYLHNVRSMCTHQGSAGACQTPQAKYKYWLSNYYKIMIVRDPLERIVSAYHNRLTTTINHPNDRIMQKMILDYYKDSSSQYPSFSQFVGFFIYSRYSLDKHFVPMMEICDPCGIKYDFYPNFKILNEDIASLLQLLNISREYYFNNIKHLGPYSPRPIHYNTSMIIDHFNELSSDQRTKFFKIMAKELEFYESLYPGELEVYNSTISEFQYIVRRCSRENC